MRSNALIFVSEIDHVWSILKLHPSISLWDSHGNPCGITCPGTAVAYNVSGQPVFLENWTKIESCVCAVPTKIFFLVENWLTFWRRTAIIKPYKKTDAKTNTSIFLFLIVGMTQSVEKPAASFCFWMFYFCNSVMNWIQSA